LVLGTFERGKDALVSKSLTYCKLAAVERESGRSAATTA